MKDPINVHSISCPVCGNDNYVVLFTDRNRRGNYDYEFKSSYVQCQECTHIYLNIIPDLSNILSLYNEIEKPHMDNDSKITNSIRVIETMISRFADKSKYYHSLPHEKVNSKRLLDIGCNDGRKLLQFRNNGWEIYGIDVAKSVIESAKKRIPDGEFYWGTLEQANFSDEYFDCIRIDNVLEHIEKPVLTLIEICRILNPRGELYIYVPNGNSFTMRFFKGYSITSWIPFHFSLFTYKSLNLALKKASLNQNNTKFLFCTPLPYLYQTIKIFIKGESASKMNLAEKFLAGLLVPLTYCINGLGMAEEIVVRARK